MNNEVTARIYCQKNVIVGKLNPKKKNAVEYFFCLNTLVRLSNTQHPTEATPKTHWRTSLSLWLAGSGGWCLYGFWPRPHSLTIIWLTWLTCKIPSNFSPPLYDHALSPENFRVIASSKSFVGLRILESLHIKTKSPNPNNTDSAFPLLVVK